MRSKLFFRPNLPKALKAIAFLVLYLMGLSLLPSAAAAYRSLTGTDNISVAQLQEPVR